MDTKSLNHKEFERQLFERRVTVVFVVVSIMLLALVGRLFFLQVIEHEKHQARSERNRLEVLPIPPIRGLIYDRNGDLLAENLPSHTLSIVVERTPNVSELLEQLSQLIELSEEQITAFERRVTQYRRPFEPVPLKVKLSEEEVAILAANRIFLTGAQVEAELIRQYPEGDAFAHVLGYVGRINSQEAEVIDRGAYAGTRFIGKQGVERQYEEHLLGKTGYQRVETNARGRIINVIEKQAPVPGANLHLFLDRQLQLKAHELLEGKRGSIVAIEPSTGGILAMVSQPSFDPNLYVTGFPTSIFNELRDSPRKPFLDRSTRGLYPPASTVKPFFGLAATDQGFINWNTTYNSVGYFQLPNDERIYRDWKRGGHGVVNMVDAIAESVDTYFYDLSVRMTLEPIHQVMSDFGFGKNTAYDVYNAASGINPSREWKRARHGFSWYAGDTVNLSIGQGYLLVTPLQAAIATAVLANKGQWTTPRLLMYSNDESLVSSIPDQAQANIELNNADNWDKVHNAMAEVMYGRRGTARAAGLGSLYTIAGKTGTAQVAEIQRDEEGVSLDNEAEHLQDHAWFIAFAPMEDPKIAIAVLVEHGGGGSAVAAPMARQLLDEYLLRASSNVE